MEICRSGHLAVAWLAIAACLLNVSGEDPLDMHVPIDPMQSEEAQNVLAISDMKAAFSAIPNFMLTSQSKEVEAESRADCESVCQNGIHS